MKQKLTGSNMLNCIAFTAMVVVNILAQTLPLGGMNTAEISALYPTLLTPAGFTFSIWFVIYAAMGWFVLHSFVSENEAASEKLGKLFAVSCLLNILWIFSWHYEIMLTATIAIAGLWLILLLMAGKVRDEKWHIKGGFDIYYAWITVAAAVQIFIYLSEIIPIRYESTTSTAVSVGVITMLTIFALVKILREKNLMFGLTMVWSLAGVLIKQYNTGTRIVYRVVEVASGIGLLVIVVALVWLIGNRSERGAI